VFTSLAVIPYLSGNRCLDVGSGAGVPGIILAMAMPELHWTLLDSNGKKTRFLNQVRIELKLGNVEVVQQRMEEFSGDRLFSTIISRGFGPLPVFYGMSVKCLSDNGVILAIKSGKPQDELNGASSLTGSLVFHTLTVPGLAQPRGLVEMRPGN
ncbi:MAG: 16S rRNA (guanine(527)-N(7))-methyltransferase RsmG, partial [Gammaproteobacteria bacterium]|nr:16S rRNA (guanine(527)-N(7))-methyltransferase RsmG [Gammaproteobacteria bacterium]